MIEYQPTRHHARIDAEVAAALKKRMTRRLSTVNKVIRDLLGLPVEPLPPLPTRARVGHMTVVLTNGARIKVL